MRSWWCLRRSSWRCSSARFKKSHISANVDVEDVGGDAQVGGGSGGSDRSSVERSSFSSLLSLLGDMVRVARLDCSLLLRTSGVEEAADTTAEEGEAGGTTAKAAW